MGQACFGPRTLNGVSLRSMVMAFEVMCVLGIGGTRAGEAGGRVVIGREFAKSRCAGV